MRRRDGNKRRRVERQDEAAARQVAYDGLTLTQRIVIARTARKPGSLPGRELTRLYTKLDAGASIAAVRLA